MYAINFADTSTTNKNGKINFKALLVFKFEKISRISNKPLNSSKSNTGKNYLMCLA